jgi:hypothetical protein
LHEQKEVYQEWFGVTEGFAVGRTVSKRKSDELAKRAALELTTVQQAMGASKKIAPGQRWYLVNAEW